VHQVGHLPRGTSHLCPFLSTTAVPHVCTSLSTRISNPSCTILTSPAPHPTAFDQPNVILWAVQITEPLVIQLSPETTLRSLLSERTCCVPSWYCTPGIGRRHRGCSSLD
jgi:hypothetical protein